MGFHSSGMQAIHKWCLSDAAALRARTRTAGLCCSLAHGSGAQRAVVRRTSQALAKGHQPLQGLPPARVRVSGRRGAEGRQPGQVLRGGSGDPPAAPNLATAFFCHRLNRDSSGSIMRRWLRRTESRQTRTAQVVV